MCNHVSCSSIPWLTLQTIASILFNVFINLLSWHRPPLFNFFTIVNLDQSMSPANC